MFINIESRNGTEGGAWKQGGRDNGEGKEEKVVEARIDVSPSCPAVTCACAVATVLQKLVANPLRFAVTAVLSRQCHSPHPIPSTECRMPSPRANVARQRWPPPPPVPLPCPHGVSTNRHSSPVVERATDFAGSPPFAVGGARQTSRILLARRKNLASFSLSENLNVSSRWRKGLYIF